MGMVVVVGGVQMREGHQYSYIYLDQFLKVLLATFTTGLIFVRQLICSSGQNIGLWPLVLIVSQK